MIAIGNTNISKIFLGNTTIAEAYLGENKVFGGVTLREFKLSHMKIRHGGGGVESKLFNLRRPSTSKAKAYAKSVFGFYGDFDLEFHVRIGASTRSFHRVGLWFNPNDGIYIEKTYALGGDKIKFTFNGGEQLLNAEETAPFKFRIKRTGTNYEVVYKNQRYTFTHNADVCYAFMDLFDVGGQSTLYGISGTYNYGPTPEQIKVMNKYGWDLDGEFTLGSKESFNAVYTANMNTEEFSNLMKDPVLIPMFGNVLFWKYCSNNRYIQVLFENNTNMIDGLKKVSEDVADALHSQSDIMKREYTDYSDTVSTLNGRGYAGEILISKLTTYSSDRTKVYVYHKSGKEAGMIVGKEAGVRGQDTYSMGGRFITFSSPTYEEDGDGYASVTRFSSL